MRRAISMAAGRISKSPISAATSVIAVSRPNSRKDGRSENTVTPKPKASTKVVSSSAGPTRTVARLTPVAGSSPVPRLQAQAVQIVDGGVERQAEGDCQRHDAGELQSFARQCQKRASREDREQVGEYGHQPDQQRTEGEADQQANERHFGGQAGIEL